MNRKLSPAVVVGCILLALGIAALVLMRASVTPYSPKEIEDAIAATVIKPGQSMPGAPAKLPAPPKK